MNIKPNGQLLIVHSCVFTRFQFAYLAFQFKQQVVV